MSRRRKPIDIIHSFWNKEHPESEDPHIIDAAVSDRDGDSVAEPLARWSDTRGAESYRPRSGLFALILVLVVAMIGVVWVLAGPLAGRTTQQFVILVSPFTSEDDNQTGQNVANELVTTLREQVGGDDVVIDSIRQVPADADTALDILAARDADVLIWGEVRAGGMLNDTSLLPRLSYQPTGPANPNGWIGYAGRFKLPHTYALANEPINGQAILPRLLTALVEYNQGNADVGYRELGQLLDDYPTEINTTLPSVLRGNVLWAYGAYNRAAGEYRRALSQPAGVLVSERALLANNLGAILLDAGDASAINALSEATQLLPAEQDLGELRFNWGILAQRQGDISAAIASFEQARNLLANTPPLPASLLLALTHVYREEGWLGAAEETLREAMDQIDANAGTVPPDQRDLFTRYLNAAAQEQRALLELAYLVDAQGPLAWELELAAPLPPHDLRLPLDILSSAVEMSRNAISEWYRRAPPRDVVQPGTGLIAHGQAQRMEAEYDRQRYHLALMLIEDGRNQLSRQRGLLGEMRAFLFNETPPLQAAQELLDALSADDPGNLAVRIAAARALRYGTPEQRTQAVQRYDELIALPAPPPESFFGKGMLALDAGNRTQARELMEQAIERDAAFFPARIKLAEIAQQEDDWPTVIAQLRYLAEQRPAAGAAVRLASALRQRGAQHLAEAESLLLPFVEEAHVPAMIELGRVYRDAGQVDMALTMFEDALRIEERSAEAAFELGQTLANERGDAAGAEQYFLDAIAYGDNTALAHLALADLYANQLDKPAAAQEHYRHAIEAGVQDVATLTKIGNILLEHNQGQAAAETFRLALEHQPESPVLHHGLGQAYLLLDNLNEASTAEQRALELMDRAGINDPDLRTAILVGRGDVTRKLGQYDQAIDFYNQALALNPTQVDAKIGLGQVFASQGNWAVALRHFQAAAAFPEGQNDPMAHFWVAEALLRQPDLEAAIAAYQQALSLRPAFPEALLGMAQAQYALNDTAAAARSIAEALEQRPAYAEALLFQGKMLQNEGRINSALEAYSASINANNSLPETYYRRGLIYIQQHDYNDAVDDLERAIALQPNFPDAYYWLGRAYFAQDRMRQALFAFERAVELQGGSFVEARLYQGMAEKALVEEEVAKRDAAIASFQAVIQADGDGPWGTLAQAELDSMGQ